MLVVTTPRLADQDTHIPLRLRTADLRKYETENCLHEISLTEHDTRSQIALVAM